MTYAGILIISLQMQKKVKQILCPLPQAMHAISDGAERQQNNTQTSPLKHQKLRPNPWSLFGHSMKERCSLKENMH